jgi:hypothetical protein
MTAEDSSSSSSTNSKNKCGIYLAPSTIPGAGLGMFAGHSDYHEGEYSADGDIVIPAYEMT